MGAVMASARTQVVESVYEAWNGRRLDALTAWVTPDVIWTSPVGAHGYPDAFGLTEFEAKIRAAARAWDGWTAQVDRTLRTDETVLVTGAHVRSADGRTVAFRHLWDVRDGQLCRLREQIDSTALLHVIAGLAA